MLDSFSEEIWTSSGPEVVAMMGFHYPTRMAVIRLTGGRLFVWSPVAITEALRSQIEALGRVAYIVAPNSLHDTFIADWQDIYPAALVFGPRDLREKRPDLRFYDDLNDEPPAHWAGEIDQVMVRGNRITNEVVFFHRSSQTALFTDLLQQFPQGWFRGWRAIVAKLDLMLEKAPTVPRKFRAAFSDRPAARASVRRILQWPTERVLMAHGTPVMQAGQTFLRQAFRWLRP